MSQDNDSYTEVTESSWGERLGNSFKGIITGIVMIIASTVLMYWNEGRTVHQGDAIAEAQMATEAMPSIDKVDPAFEGKMIHAFGKAMTTDELVDPLFGVKTTAIQLRRSVEYYQWSESSHTETRKKVGGGEEKVTTYTYSKGWVSSPVSSGSFKRPAGHENTVRLQADNNSLYASNVTFGAYRLPSFIIEDIGGARPMTMDLSERERAELQRSFFGDENNAGSSQSQTQTQAQNFSAGLANLFGGHAAAAPEVVGPTNLVHNNGTYLYFGNQPNDPAIGDVRVTFTQTPPAEISILARVSGDSFQTFRASNGCTFHRVDMGRQDMNIMYEDAQSENAMLAWILRLVGLLICVGGFRAVVAPLSVIADVIPLLGDIVGAGTGLIAGLVGTAWSLIVIAIAWLRFRPILGISLLAVALVLIVLLFIRGRQKKAAAAAAAAHAQQPQA